MLRTIIQIFAFLFLLCAMVLVVVEPTAWPALPAAGILILGTLWERFYYRGGTVSGSGGRWQATQERFLDEESGGLVTVWFNPTTGERRYVDQGAAPPG
jgi:hypothetical protein